MGCWEDMIEAIEKMGDPYVLANSEDLVVLKLDKPLPGGRSIPQQLTADSSRTVLTTCQDGFISCRSFLVKHSYSTVLFSGLPELKSTKGLLVAARDVVLKAQELIIVHNRDLMADLVSWFSKLTRLILYHDLTLQSDSSDEVMVLAHMSHLRQVWGTTPAVGTEELFLCPQTLAMLLANCPSLSEIQAPLNEAVMLADRFRARSPHFPPVFNNCRELTLGSYLRRSTRSATMMGTASLPCVNKALELYPNLEQLQISTIDRDVLAFIPKFSRLKRLSIMYGGRGGMCPFSPYITDILQALHLTRLTIKYFKGILLSTIARHCPNLECLSLLDCNLCDEAIQPGSFTKLRSLALSDCNMDEAFFTLLNDAEGLTDLHLDGEWAIASYVSGPAEPSHPRPIHRKMELLTLATDWSLRALYLLPDEVRTMIESMPVLRRLSTNSYDIRLCVQNYYPHVTLTWSTCTTCMAEFPKVGFVQDYIWRSLHTENKEDDEDT
uniref:Uncharacterized protein n=1 Tax=Rhipicephalus appendiculatus TaxID=34631 RepID=A0A131YXE0_RHIAP